MTRDCRKPPSRGASRRRALLREREAGLANEVLDTSRLVPDEQHLLDGEDRREPGQPRRSEALGQRAHSSPCEPRRALEVVPTDDDVLYAQESRERTQSLRPCRRACHRRDSIPERAIADAAAAPALLEVETLRVTLAGAASRMLSGTRMNTRTATPVLRLRNVSPLGRALGGRLFFVEPAAKRRGSREKAIRGRRAPGPSHAARRSVPIADPGRGGAPRPIAC